MGEKIYLFFRLYNKIFFNQSLKYKVISLFVLAVILPSLLFSFILTSISKKSIRNSIFYQQQEIVKNLADKINSQIENHLKLLSLYKQIWKLPDTKQYEAAQNLLLSSNDFSEITILDASGMELWKCARTGILPNLLNRSRKPEYIKAVTDKLFISHVYFSKDHKPYILLSVPFSLRRGVIVAKVDLMQMWRWISEIKIGETGTAFVVDRKGILIAHRDTERVLADSNFENLPVIKDFLNQIQLSTEHWPEYRNERGKKVVAFYQVLPPNLGWAVAIQISAEEVYMPIQKMYKNIILWTLFWITVFLFIGFHFVKQIINPLSMLQAGAEQISRGNLNIKLDIKTGDEIELLAKNFEKMAVSLKNLEELRQDLIRMIIHDLKSPLSGIMGSLDYLESGVPGRFTEEQKNILSVAKKSSESMLDMIQNLLDVAKMEEGVLELRKEKFDIVLMLKECKNQYDALAAGEGKIISIIGCLPGLEQKISIEAERSLIVRVVNNLISNAINHTSSGGKISIALRKKANFLEIRVSDNGAGISKEYCEKIFEKFVQIKKKQAHLRTGAGLGLTFCKMIIELHGGKIYVESRIKEGSTFVFTLPLLNQTEAVPEKKLEIAGIS